MLITEWNWDDAMRVREEEGVQQGMQQGMKEILKYLKSGHSLEEAEKKFNFN